MPNDCPRKSSGVALQGGQTCVYIPSGYAVDFWYDRTINCRVSSETYATPPVPNLLLSGTSPLVMFSTD